MKSTLPIGHPHKNARLPVPGLLLDAYPEQQESEKNSALNMPLWLKKITGRLFDHYAGHARFIKQIRDLAENMQALDESQFQNTLQRLQLALYRDGFADRHVAQAFALIATLSSRLLGLTPYDAQFIGARIVLDNHLAEMATGEGKSLTVALAAATAALAGIPVHVITANDYLVERDARKFRPLYSALGLTTGTITQNKESPARRAAYACNITYCTAKELVFDYLRDSLSRHRDPLHWHIAQLSGSKVEQPMLRGLCMAIIDEADSILIDEARVPLIISRALDNTQEQEFLTQSLHIARSLQVQKEFTINAATLTASLTDRGRQTLDEFAQALPAIWRNRLHREEVVGLALAALHLFQRDRHYLIHDEKVVIIDENTGRTAPGRSWSRGLHQLIELKENCAFSAQMETAAQITYQRFFPRYLRLAGLSGTLQESRDELQDIYQLSVYQVPLHKACRRIKQPHRFFPDRLLLGQAVTTRAAELHQSGRPVLIGTDSVADTQTLSRLLTEAGLPHTVLNANHDRDEAHIIENAGCRGAITVATNMAGRGTDIPLAPGVAELGGLHVICCQLNGARRIDRQLAGRSARQGDPGSVETWLALDAPLLDSVFSSRMLRLVQKHSRKLPVIVLKFLFSYAQRLTEQRQILQRKRMLEHDRHLDRALSFSKSGD